MPELNPRRPRDQNPVTSEHEALSPGPINRGCDHRSQPEHDVAVRASDTRVLLPGLRPQRLSGRREPEAAAADVFLRGFLAEPASWRKDQYLGREAAGSAISRLRISGAFQRQALLAIEDGLECRQAGPVRCSGSRGLGAARRLSPREQSSFWTRKKAAGCCPQQKAYIYAWVDAVAAAGFHAGIYCSGIAAKEDGGVSVVTAEDVRQDSAGRKIVYWVANDACPPSPGCAFPKLPPSPSGSGIDFAEVWQFAQSPKRPDFAAGCPANYNRDGSCYPPGIDHGQRLYVDVNTATSADPSHGKTR